MKRRLLALTLVFTLLLSIFSFPVGAVETPTTGLTPADYHSYSANKQINTVPRTMEAWVNYSENSSHTSTIFGNYYSSNSKNAYALRIYKGYVTVYLFLDGVAYADLTINFEDATVSVNEWTFISVTFNIDEETPTNSKASCYINGQLEQELPLSENQIKSLQYEHADPASEYVTPIYSTLGSYRSLKDKDNRREFDGQIAYFAAYSDVRTDNEIANDMNNYKTNPDTDGMVVGYDLSVDGRVHYEDLSLNNNDLHWMGRKYVDNDYYTEVDQDDYAFSFAVIGDTQAANEKANETAFQPMFDWIRNNAYSMNIKAVISVGDITNRNTPTQWQNAKEAYAKLDGIVPTVPILGNHDVTAKYDTNNEGAKEGLYKEYFQVEDTRSYNGSINAYYTKVHVGGIKYLILAVSYGHTAEERAWAEQVIQDHQDYNVILTTHAYLNSDKTHLDRDGAPYILNDLVKPYSNVVLVTCGHMRNDNVLLKTDTREDGSVFQQLFTNPQDADASLPGGVVTMLYFSADGKNVTVRNYATALNCYLGSENPDSFELTLKEGGTCNTVTVTADENGKITLPSDDGAGRGLFSGWVDDEGKPVTSESTFSEGEMVNLTATYINFDKNMFSDFVDTDGNSADDNPVPTDAKYTNGMYVQGVQVRIPEKDDGKALGLRFITVNNTNITKAIEAGGMEVVRGTLVMLKRFYNSDSGLYMDTEYSIAVNADAVFQSEAVLKEGYDKYNACVTNFTTAYLQEDIVVRPYYIYTDLSGKEHIYYGETYWCNIYDAAVDAYNRKGDNDGYFETAEVREALDERVIKLCSGDNEDDTGNLFG